MPFPVTYLIDQLAPSETFIRRELEQLRRRNWTVYARLLIGGEEPLRFSLLRCPKGFRRRFVRAACARMAEELFRAPGTACRILKRLPQAADLARTVVETDSQLIHAHFAGITADLTSIVSCALDVPWTCSVHAHDVFTVSPPLLHRRLRTACAVTACSQRAAQAVIACGYPPDSVVPIHHGLPLNEFSFDRRSPRDVIFTAGRLAPKKGIDTLIRACSLLKARSVRFTCVIAGTGALLHQLRQLVEKLMLEECIVFVGWQPQEALCAQLREASVLALPSRRMRNGDSDGIANVILEALALGTPIITTTASSASEVIADSVNGLLVPPDNPERLAEALATALASNELLDRLAKAGRKTAEDLFDGAKNIQQLESFFAQAVKASPQLRRPKLP